MKKILVPCDFSAKSKEALKFAVDIAAMNKGEVILLHVIYSSPLYQPLFVDNLGGSPIDVMDYMQQMQKEADKELEKLQKSFEKTAISIKIHTTIGDTESAILQKAEDLACDLIVMGTSGASGLEELLIGSVTEKIVRRSKIPVIAVRKAPKVNEIKKILFPSNLENGQENFIEKVKSLQKSFNAELHLLLVNTPTHFQPDTKSWEALNAFIHQHKLKNCFAHLTSHWTEELGILEFQSANDLDMIIMSTHGRKGLQHLFRGSIAEHVVNHISCPIWTCHAHPHK